MLINTGDGHLIFHRQPFGVSQHDPRHVRPFAPQYGSGIVEDVALGVQILLADAVYYMPWGDNDCAKCQCCGQEVKV